MWFLSVITPFIIAIFAICYKIFAINRYWIKRDVPHIQPWPIIGNMYLIFKKFSMTEYLSHLYTTTPHERYFGVYYFTQPCLLLKDLNIIKEVTIKNFQSFPEHNTVVSESADPLFSKTLLFMKADEKWQKLRSAITPAFTSSKIKTMFNLMNNCALSLLIHVEEQKGDVVLEMKNLFSKYTNDVIGNCIVGVSCNSFQNPSNSFFKLATETSNSFKSIKTFVHAVSPTLAHMLKIRLISKYYSDYWIKLTNEVITAREKGDYRPDMVELLLKAKNGLLINDEAEGQRRKNKPEASQYLLTNDDIAAQTLLFFFAGYETSSTTMTFATYELATNFEIQAKLQEEIDAVLEKHVGDSISVTYEDLLEMKYMDAVILETLRKWPPITYTDRKVKKQHIIESTHSNEKPVRLDPGVVVWIPIFAIHRDPKYYPDPEKFDPDRFYKDTFNTVPCSFLPFGLGPKSCMGSRFALLEVKIVLFHILSKFDIVPVKKTPIPMPIKGKLLLETGKDCWLGLKLRK